MKLKRALSNKEKRALGIKGKQAFIYETKKGELIVADNVPLFINYNGTYVPTLKGSYEKLPKVWVDKGAVAFLVKGADLLRPGITEMEPFSKNEPVVVYYEDVPIGIGIALVGSEEAEKMEKGKILKMLHVKGDEIWNFGNG